MNVSIYTIVFSVASMIRPRIKLYWPPKNLGSDGPGHPQKVRDHAKDREKPATNFGKQENPPRKQGLAYLLWAKNPFSILTGMTSEEPLLLVSTVIASSQEGSPRSPKIMIHDLEAPRAQSSARPRGSRG